MKTIVAADIHGVTAELRTMLQPIVGDAVVLSPWETDACPFGDEGEAVTTFVARDGIASYARKISAAAAGEPAFIVAFSVGASAAWLHAASGDGNPHSAATLFYGSRIRDYASLKPRFDITAIFAETEASFSPARLADIIAGGRVRTFVEPGTLHGFMNPRSPNFVAARCAVHLQRLALELAQFRRAICDADRRHNKLPLP
jgi:dienelactone hydrolase